MAYVSDGWIQCGAMSRWNDLLDALGTSGGIWQ